EDLEELAWSITDTFEGTIKEHSITLGGKPKSMLWWNEHLAEARDGNPTVYRKACKETRTNFYRERRDSAKSPKKLGNILLWRKDSLDDRPTLINTQDGKLTDPEDIATYLANAAFRPAREEPLPTYQHQGPTLPSDIAQWILDTPSDDEIREAFL
ncbi:hypothetical protein B0T09DRAFT_227468, partial [Sordaria sp. MPI-SDFR-AT-0083]